LLNHLEILYLVLEIDLEKLAKELHPLLQDHFLPQQEEQKQLRVMDTGIISLLLQVILLLLVPVVLDTSWSLAGVEELPVVVEQEDFVQELYHSLEQLIQ
jgi:hypothetical protein